LRRARDRQHEPVVSHPQRQLADGGERCDAGKLAPGENLRAPFAYALAARGFGIDVGHGGHQLVAAHADGAAYRVVVDLHRFRAEGRDPGASVRIV